MNDQDLLASRFENHRDYLNTVAYRMLGSTGEANDADCHPDADSPANVTCPNRTPDADHTEPTCVPVSPNAL